MRSRFKMTEREKVQARLVAAKLNGGAAAAIPRGEGRFTVVGRAGDRYTVVVFDRETMRCDCSAGRNSVNCWQAASVFLRITSDSMIHTSLSEVAL